MPSITEMISPISAEVWRIVSIAAAAPEAWLFLLGGLFVFVTLFLPRGIVGTFDHGWRALRERRHAARAEKGVSTGSGVASPNPAE